jgi:hypothetical protein
MRRAISIAFVVLLLIAVGICSPQFFSSVSLRSDWHVGRVTQNGCIDAFGRHYPDHSYLCFGPVAFELRR